MKPKIVALGLTAFFTAAIALAVWLLSGSTFDPPRRQGPPGLVQHGGVPSVWMPMGQAEHYQVSTGSSRSSSSGRLYTRYHFDLHAFDATTAQRLWKKRLLTLKSDQAGSSATMRLMGQDGEAVWMFLNNQPVALSSKDGSVLGSAAEIEQRNPQLKGLLPAEQKFYTFDEGLVLTSADARHFRIRAPGFAAEPYTPRSDAHFRYISFMSTQWNGGWQNKDFVVRQARNEGRWLGLYTEKEAADAGSDQFGEHLKRPESVLTESGIQRRALWSARIGKTKQFSEGAHDRLFDLARLPNTPEFLAGGFLISQGTQNPLALDTPKGFVVMHMTRNDEQRRLAFTRVDSALQPVWRSVMPFFEIDNRWQFADRLLMRGSIEYRQPGEARQQEFLVALDLKTGRMQGWNATLEAPAVPPGAQGEWSTKPP